jgi:hypothetical protein
LTVGSVVPSNAADKVGALFNAYTPSTSGPVRVYGSVATWDGVTSGRLWIYPTGAATSFYGSPNVLTFSSDNSAHLESNGKYNGKLARLIMDVTTNPSSISFRIIQNNVVVLGSPAAMSRPAVTSGSVTLFAP